MGTDDAKRRFASNLKRAIRARQWNQSDLARQAGVGRDCVSGYIRGLNMPNGKNLSKIAAALNKTSDELLGAPSSASSPRAPAARDDGVLKMIQLPGDPSRAYVDVRQVVPTAQALKIFALLAERCA